MNDYDYGRKVLRAHELVEVLKVDNCQSQAEADIVRGLTVELGRLSRELLTEVLAETPARFRER